MISKELEKSLNMAVQIAHEARHEFVTTEHLLFALLDNNSAMAVLQACLADIEKLESDLKIHLADNVPQIEEQSELKTCLLYTSPSPRDLSTSRMPSSA